MSAITITLTPEISEAIDRFIAGQEPKPSRDEAVNAALGDWLSQQGALSFVDCPPEIEAKGECE
ncbi:hypothetical protein [Methylobacterium brachythecii]|uniref:Arc/MetJ-type ribon-helix-helix transcriptional regulator n=1 Tax=Methylobacterium brachythecii TaxID=1176177 RepID=A0A7W6AI22_9HYPH|nr:hypothetical protein [Methylobacterium brachythecii]MBB3902741.1 Arc/MetJ-type ribon-helix-helix transcriptional regulator [Methylobacterium brachythecii]GLS42583.1 hypothetical protein GCM10007884_05680 [Methylobacterium brachythecii]